MSQTFYEQHTLAHLSFSHFADNKSKGIQLLEGVLVSPLHLLELELERVVKVHQPLVSGADHPMLSKALDGSLERFLPLYQ